MSLAALALMLLMGADGDAPPTPPGQDAADPALPPPAAEPLRYPLGERGEPDFLAPGEPFKLVDLRYGLTDTVRTEHAFGARVEVKDWGYLGAVTDGERRALSASTQRLALSVSSEQGVWGFVGSFRAPRFIVSADTQRRSDAQGGGFRLGPAVSVRLRPDLELLGEVLALTERPDDRFLRTLSAGFLWQWRAKVEASGEYRRDYVATDADAENTVDSFSADLVAQWGPVEVRGRGTLKDTEGRFPRREMDGALGARVQLSARLLAEGEAGGSLERGASTQSHAYRGALTWFGRRFTLPRSGAAAERSLALARAATAAGYNERRVFDDDGLRAQRERLSLAPTRREMSDDLAALHRAQVEERSVPLLGVEVRDSADSLTGSSRRVAALFVGVPWPPAPPWRANDAAVPFLKLGYERERSTAGLDFRAHANRLTLTVSLDRERDLVVGWRRAEPTALDLIRGIGTRTTLEAAFVYAYGR